jgi:polysaccharide pyruvyl transferase WcaK-like protein
MPKKIRVLRLASFAGNMGDVINHHGSVSFFNKVFDSNFEFFNLEIRDYFKKKNFDTSFVKLVNSYDIFVIGGGGYLETWVKNKTSSTTLDFSDKVIQSIKIPVIFYALGVNSWQGFSSNSKKRFSLFLKKIIDKKNIFFTVRNDGSFSQLKSFLDKSLLKKVSVVGDGAFFLDSFKKKKTLKKKNFVLGINLASDLFEFRFKNKKNYKNFIKETSLFFSKALSFDEKMKIILIIHVWSDYKIVSDLLATLPDHLRRRCIEVSQFNPSVNGIEDFFKIINSCDIIMGNRFHSNISSLISGVPTIGLVNFPQILCLYKELNLKNMTVNMKSKNLSEKLFKKFLFFKENRKKIIHLQNEKVKNVRKNSFLQANKIKQWLKLFF